MLLFCAAIVIIWFLGGWIGVPVKLRLGMIVLLYLGILVSHLILQDNNTIRLATGKTIGPWLVLGAISATLVLYLFALKFLRRLAKEKTKFPTELDSGKLVDTELERYSRHIMLREIGGSGQIKLKKSKVLVVGAGGLGAPVLQYLASSGVGHIGIIDDDVVETSNLQRQTIHQDKFVGVPKVFSAKEIMQAQNPYISIRPYNRRLNKSIAKDIFLDFDIIIDGSDNFETRYLTNKTAFQLGIPFVFGALSQWEGQISVFYPIKGGPCYECIFPEKISANQALSCSEGGVFAPLPGVIGSIMAVEALKLITSVGKSMMSKLLIYDALNGEMREIKLSKNEDCAVCNVRVNE